MLFSLDRNLRRRPNSKPKDPIEEYRVWFESSVRTLGLEAYEDRMQEEL